MKLIMENFNKFLAEQVDKENFLDKVQELIDKDVFLRDEVELKATADNMIEGGNYVLFYSPDSLKHIEERHKDPNAPGSLFYGDIKKSIESTLKSNPPSEFTDKKNNRTEKPVVGGRVKWLGMETNEVVGKMGVKKASPEEVSAMKTYDRDWETPI